MKNNLTEHKVPSRKDWIPLAIFSGYIFAGLIYFGLMWLVSLVGASENFLKISGIIILIIVVIPITKYDAWLWHNTWRKVAKTIGLNKQIIKDITLSHPEMEGKYQGRSVYISGYTVRSGKRKKPYTNIYIGLEADIKESMEILASGEKSKLRRDSSYQSLKIGDKNFDKKLKVKSTKAAFAKEILSATALREGLLEVRAWETRIFISEKGINFSEPGHMVNDEYLRALLNILIELAKTVEHYARYTPDTDVDYYKPDLPEKEETVSTTEHNIQNAPEEDISKAPIIKRHGSQYADIQRFLQERLIPLGFKEASTGDRASDTETYTRGEERVKLAAGYGTYIFEIPNINLNMKVKVSGKKRKEEFKTQAIKEFNQWLPTLEDDAKSISKEEKE